MNTLLLDKTTWDLTVDGSKNIALATGPYAIAQDVASAIKTFQGELWYDTSQGIPYWSNELGVALNQQRVQADMNTAALLVPGVEQAKTVVSLDRVTRILSGTVSVIDAAGKALSVTF